VTLTDKELSKQLGNVYGATPFYRLRWRFDFANRPSRYGVWNGASPHKSDMAAFVPKDGLVRAAVEGIKVARNVNVILAEVDGHNFASFAWDAAVGLPSIGLQGSFSRESTIVGLSILSRTEKITVYIDGKVKRRPLTGHEMKFKLEEHKGGS
jgi:hypothetical protein